MIGYVAGIARHRLIEMDFNVFFYMSFQRFKDYCFRGCCFFHFHFPPPSPPSPLYVFVHCKMVFVFLIKDVRSIGNL